MSATTRLSRALLGAHPQDSARVLEGIPPADATAVLSSCPPRVAARVLLHMAPPGAAQRLALLDTARAAAVAAEFPMDRGGDILRRMPPELAEAMLEAIPGEAGKGLRRLLRFPEGTAGSLMDPLSFALPDDITVGEARKRLRKVARDLRYYVYVVDRDRRLVGVLNLREFMLSGPREFVGAVMHRDPAALRARTASADIIRSPYWRKFLSMPVVDDKGIFLGAVKYDVLRRLERSLDMQSPERRLVESLLSFGELYWVGLVGLLEGLEGGLHAR